MPLSSACDDCELVCDNIYVDDNSVYWCCQCLNISSDEYCEECKKDDAEQ